MGRPREYDDSLRVRLIENAAQVLTAEGPHALTTRRIATESGTSTTAIYSLIGGKDELVRAMFREGFTRLADHLATGEPSEDPLEDLRRLRHEYHAMAVESPHLYKIMFDCPIPEFVPTHEDSVFALSTLDVLVRAVQRAIDAGALAGDAHELAVQLWALNHGVTTLALSGMLGPDPDAVTHLDHASDAMLIGFRPDA